MRKGKLFAPRPALARGQGLFLGVALMVFVEGCRSTPSRVASPAGGNGRVAAASISPQVSSKWPTLPPLGNVVVTENDDSAAVRFEPVDGARDYRVYPLPKDEDIVIGQGGGVTVKNGTYRCSGDREAPAPMVDDGPEISGDGIRTKVDRQSVGGYLRTRSEASLGYVYAAPGDGRLPVFALGDPDPNGDNSCFFARWTESRVKRYTASPDERDRLLAARWRDDGVAFYVPAAAAPDTRPVFTDADGHVRFYFSLPAEAQVHPRKELAFYALAAPREGATSLMRVYYSNDCGAGHDELAAGGARFERAYRQGDGQPWWSLLWTGLTGPTTLVVEALDAGCPFQGYLSPKSVPAAGNYQSYVTLEEARRRDPSGELFINGQHDPGSRPRALARSFVRVSPKRHPPMDWFADFSPLRPAEVWTEIPCGSPDGNCFQTWRQQSPTLDATFHSVQNDRWALGNVLGELWVTYADWASDVNGKVRLTPKKKAAMSASAYLHVTMEVDAVSTGRRYPQILISDRDAPIQYFLDKGNTLVVQTLGDWPILYQIQVCDHRNWDVNFQCPAYDLYHVMGPSKKVESLAPNDEVGEHTSVDHRTKFDVFASTRRAYLFLDGAPYGCADLPSAGVPSGEVTVTFGDVLYHSGVDKTFAFHRTHMQLETRRHFDNLGFSSAVPAPPWDEARLPCARPISL